MIKLPKILRKLKFDSQRKLVQLIIMAIDAFICTSKDYEFTDKSSYKLEEMENDDFLSDEEYQSYLSAYNNDYERYTLASYVNIMSNHISISVKPDKNAIFSFQLSETNCASEIFKYDSNIIGLMKLRDELLNEFLPKNCPGFKFIS